MKTPQEHLNEAAENYVITYMKKISETKYKDLEKRGLTFTHQDSLRRGFEGGALSTEAANGCNKHVEKVKIEFAIEMLNKCFTVHYMDIIEELQTKLNQLEQ